MPDRFDVMPRHVCPFLKNRLLNPVDQPQRVHHELQPSLFGIHLSRGDSLRVLLIQPRLSWPLGSQNPIVDADLTVGTGADTQIISEAPIREIVFALPVGFGKC